MSGIPQENCAGDSTSSPTNRATVTGREWDFYENYVEAFHGTWKENAVVYISEIRQNRSPHWASHQQILGELVMKATVLSISEEKEQVLIVHFNNALDAGKCKNSQVFE